MKQGDEARKHVRQLMAGLNEGHWSSAAGPDLGLTARNSVDLCQYIKMFTVSKEQAPIVPLGPFTPAEGDAVRAACNAARNLAGRAGRQVWRSRASLTRV
ncbi:MAG: hypothetical protein R3F17_13265 [Planctomycetota bacterium]